MLLMSTAVNTVTSQQYNITPNQSAQSHLPDEALTFSASPDAAKVTRGDHVYHIYVLPPTQHGGFTTLVGL